MANELQDQLDKLSNQARFIRMIVSKELVISGRKKIDIIAELRKKDFRPFSKIKKAKSAGETEEVIEEEEEEGDSPGSSDYDYLLGMAISSLTKEKVWAHLLLLEGHSDLSYFQIDKLEQQAKTKEMELLVLLELTPIQIWNTDLDNFMMEWEVIHPQPLSSSGQELITTLTVELVQGLGGEGHPGWRIKEGQTQASNSSGHVP